MISDLVTILDVERKALLLLVAGIRSRCVLKVLVSIIIICTDRNAGTWNAKFREAEGIMACSALIIYSAHPSLFIAYLDLDTVYNI